MQSRLWMSLRNGDMFEISSDDLKKYDGMGTRDLVTLPSGIRVRKEAVDAIYPDGSQPEDAMMKKLGRPKKKSSVKKQGGAKGKLTMIERYGPEGAARLVGEGTTERITKEDL